MEIESRDLDKREIRKRYLELSPKYEKLAINLKQAFEFFLEEVNISHLPIDYRIKDTDSFIEKINRKEYKDPFKQIEDICGLRVICYYESDIQKISNIIKREFRVFKSQDKEDLLNIDQFGYRSSHFIIKIKKSWSKTPNYRGLEDLKAEIQVRTVLMHAWDEIEHKLAYKKEIHIPNQFKRKLYMISAKLEEADEQFEGLRKDIEGYRKELIDKADKEDGIFDKSLPVNLDNLQTFLDYYFPDRKRDIKDTQQLLDELLVSNISMREIVDSYHKIKEYLPQIDKEYKESFDKYKGLDIIISSMRVIALTQGDILRMILKITIDRYFKRSYPPTTIYITKFGKELHDFIYKWKKILENKR